MTDKGNLPGVNYVGAPAYLIVAVHFLLFVGPGEGADNTYPDGPSVHTQALQQRWPQGLINSSITPKQLQTPSNTWHHFPPPTQI